MDGISLEWALGLNTAPNGTHAVADDVYFFCTGSVGVLYSTAPRRQILLRGHVRV